MNGLQHLSGPSPFGGKSIAERQSYYSLLVEKKREEMKKAPARRRRSTADEAKATDETLTSVEINSKFCNNKTFVACCLKASESGVKVKPTKRQAAKFRKGHGAAYAMLKLL